MAVRDIAYFPQEMEIPGFIAGGGINRSVPRLALSPIECWTANNLHPTEKGFGNIGIGITKQNTNRLTTDPVRTIFRFGSKRLFVRSGNLYSIPFNGGSETLEASSAFSSTAKIRWAIGRGNSGIIKVFLCDGVNQPKVWDGTSLSNITAFAGDILTEIKVSHRPNKVINYKNRIVWSFDNSGVNASYVLASDLESGETYTAGAGADNAFFEIIDTSGQEITAIATLKRSGDNQEDLAIVAYTEKEAFVGQATDVPDTNRFGVFVNTSKDIGAINQECVINYLNDLYSMSKRGIGSLSGVGNEIQSVILEAGIRVNSLIQAGSLNTAFDQSYIIHCKERNTIWASMPADQTTGTGYEGYNYPETPMNLTLCYTYAIQTASGQVSNVWTSRQGAGWAFACSDVDGQDIYLGSYFGDIYKAFEGTEYERKPSDPNTRRPFTSSFESGDLTLNTSLVEYKEILEIITKFYVTGAFRANFSAFWDGAETGPSSPDKIVSTSGNALWDVALWDVDLWGGSQLVDINVTPPNGGRTVRLLIKWESEIDSITNAGSVYALSGILSKGKRLLRFV